MDDGIIQQLRQMQAGFHLAERNDYAHRKQQLLKLKKGLLDNEQLIYDALHTDLKKNKEESWVTELGFVIAEINHALRQLKRWMRPERAGTNLLNLPSKSYIIREPLGTVLIIGPWNYPVQLSVTPLIGAIAAGNKVVLKPSEHAPATAAAIQKIISENFDRNEILVVQGNGAEVIPAMIKQFRFDHIFYTGNQHVGKLVYEMAASQLVPVTMELGGKSPCIIETDADIKVTAKRIALAKFSNAGQMCVAPDYLLVHESVKDKLLNELKFWIYKFYASEDVRDYHYGKIINERQFKRLVEYIDAGTIFHGGAHDPDKLHIEPTVLVDVTADDEVMKEEIFGPVLPVLTWKNEEEVYAIIRKNPEPLSLYVFTSSDEKANKWIRSIPFGGGCINNTSWHLTNYNLPFGGRGSSGFGRYHGKYSFETFSHTKAIMKTPTWFDPAVKYPPFKDKLNLFKKIIR
ncbi:MAG TPA: aldehyde dehydrogenase family protein [Chitinophagaceae bacterium]